MDRIFEKLNDRIMTADEAAAMIKPGMVLGCSGFTGVGHPKALPPAIAKQGTAKGLTLLTGASVGDVLDGELVRAGLVAHRFPYQTNKSMRDAINAGEVEYADMHLSHMPAFLNRGVGPHIDFAIIECAAVTEQGLVPAATVGASDSFVYNADKVIVEINTTIPMGIVGMHDIYRVHTPFDPAPIPLTDPAQRIGDTVIPCPMEKIAAVVITEDAGSFPVFKPADDVSKAIGSNIVDFLKKEVAAGRQPKSLFPIQSGVGSVANAVLYGLADGGFDGMRMYTEVLQDSALELVKSGKLASASATSLSLSKEMCAELYENIDFYRERIVIRPQEVANHPELARRMGLVSLNTPIECDIYGNVNSTHVMGSKVMNGLGGSGDFARNAGLTIFATESVAKGGAISCIVPMVSHVDHTEHDVQVIVTERGYADLRWKSPKERAKLIIENCAHPDYKPMLEEYFAEACANAPGKHTPHILTKALSWHERFLETGSMKK